jgi:hypothetical protein
MHAIHGNISFQWRRKVIESLQAYGCLNAEIIYAEWRQAACKRGHQLEFLSTIAHSTDRVCFPDLFSCGLSLLIDVPGVLVDFPWIDPMTVPGVTCRWIDRESGVLYEGIQLDKSGRQWLPPVSYLPGMQIDLDLVQFCDGSLVWSLPSQMSLQAPACLFFDIATDDDSCEEYSHDIVKEYAHDFTVPLCSYDLFVDEIVCEPPQRVVTATPGDGSLSVACSDKDNGDADGDSDTHSSTGLHCSGSGVDDDGDDDNYADFYAKFCQASQIRLSRPKYFWADMVDSGDEDDEGGDGHGDAIEPEPEAG